MRVLLTGSAGFIGSAVGRALGAAGHEVVPVDAMLDLAHGATAPPPGTHQVDVRDAARWTDLLHGVDVVCHQAAVVGAGVRVADIPAYAGHNDLGTAALLAAMHEARVSALVLASSMVVYGEGRYICPEHGRQRPGPRSRQALEAGDFENHCPVCRGALGWEAVDENPGRVRDSGPGMDPEVLTKVFDRFFRADPSRTRSHGGAGLGLAIREVSHGGPRRHRHLRQHSRKREHLHRQPAARSEHPVSGPLDRAEVVPREVEGPPPPVRPAA